MKIKHRRFSFEKSVACVAFLAASFLPTAAFAEYSSSSDTEAGVLDYIENERRAARENRLTEAQEELIKDTADMQAHLRQPMEEHLKPLPTAFEGDELFYDQVTGEFFARGSVRITEIDNRRILSDEIKGNAVTQDVSVENEAHILQMTPGMARVDIRGSKLSYNYGTGIGKVEDASGKVNRQYISGKRIEVYPDKVILYEGRATKCSAKTPDYSVSAKRIEYYPNDKIVFYDCDLWLKKTRVGHRDKYTADIRPGQEDTPPFPSVSYTKDDGLLITQDFTLPIAKQIDFIPALLLSTKDGVHGRAEIRHSGAYGTLSLQYGYWQDIDDRWIRRAPSLHYEFGHHFKDAPIGWGVEMDRGTWHNAGIKSTHTYGKVNIYHDPIPLGGGASVSFATDYSVTKESYNRSRVSGLSWSATLLKKFNDRLTVYGKYSYAQLYSGNSLFDYNVSDYSRALYTGLSYQLTEHDRIVCGTAYDLDRRTLGDVDYYWYHDMHCVQLITRYRAKRDSWSVRLNFTPW